MRNANSASVLMLLLEWLNGTAQSDQDNRIWSCIGGLSNPRNHFQAESSYTEGSLWREVSENPSPVPALPAEWF